jgi:FAD/FMN-containing dehydrogenase
MPCWPAPDEWRALAAKLKGTLEQPRSPFAPCLADATSDACKTALDALKNPFYVQDQAGGTQSSGWYGAWTAAPSAYAVAAETTSDVVAAIDFARRHNLRVVIKGTGHDYLGRSNAPGSLLIWTHRMRKVTVADAFVPRGCAPPGTPAVTVEAGTRWIEAYQEVTGKHRRYVQGGGCTSVGAAGGFLQGGGFGSWSRKYGIAASNMLEAEVVTADGRIVVANACQNQDLFWALRGGGGGTFGVVTQVTLRTHPLPNFFGSASGKIGAKTELAFKELVERALAFYRDSLNNEHWGEQIRIRRRNELEISMVFQGMTAKEAEQVWQPLRAWADARPDQLTVELHFGDIPGEKMWDRDFAEQHFAKDIVADARPGELSTLFWWKGDGEQVGAYWYAYQSRWLPLNRFAPASIGQLADLLFRVSRHSSLELHFNKAQAGAAPDAVARGRQTAMNPAVFDAAALVIIGARGDAQPGVREPDAARAEKSRSDVSAAMRLLRDATPDGGSYVNETDYFEPDWQRSFWGPNYPKLLAIKRKYDPSGLFTCHHCVGSEEPTAP